MKENIEPLVSVIIPTYNRAHVIDRPIKSVINQTYKNWELIIVDDKGTDNTKEKIASYQKAYSNIKYVINERSKGPSGARNMGILTAKGKYLAFLDSDDEWVDIHLQECVAALEENEALIQFCGAFHYTYYPSTNMDMNRYFYRTATKKAIDSNNPIIKDKLLIFDSDFFEYATSNYYFPHINTIVINRVWCLDNTLFDETIVHAGGEDVYFILHHVFKGRMGMIQEYHLKYYQEESDSLYAYINRLKLDINTIQDKKIILRLEQNVSNSLKCAKGIIRLIKKSDKIKDKKRLINKKKTEVAYNFFTISYLMREHDLKKYVKYGIMSQLLAPNFNLICLSLVKLFCKYRKFELMNNYDNKWI